MTFFDLDIVQVTEKDGKIQCRLSPHRSKPISMFFETVESAFASLIGLMENKSIHLLVLRDLFFSNESFRIQMVIKPKSIELVSMTNVCLYSIDPENFQQLVQGPFKARKYTFNTMRNVNPGSFCDNLLFSDAFLHAQSVSFP